MHIVIFILNLLEISCLKTLRREKQVVSFASTEEFAIVGEDWSGLLSLKQDWT